MIRFENVSKIYEDGFQALSNINLNIEKGELVALIGPSGCGKTTTMRMINRLIEPTTGTIYVNGEDISQVNPVELRRNIGYVIQQIGLIPHMTIGKNIGLVPRLKGWKESAYSKRVDELLEMVGLDPKVFRERYPFELSGGQQQRVGVIRALAAEPPIILMDEPFSALDPISREQLQDELVKLQKEIHKTIVFVTHDMDEALKIADRIAIMRNGNIVQLDTPENILKKPKNDFVRDFIGEKRLSRSSLQFEITHFLSPRMVVAKKSDRVADVLNQLRECQLDVAFLTDDDHFLLGIIDRRDLEKQGDNHAEVSKIARPVKETVNELSDWKSVPRIFAEGQMKVIPVTSGAKLVGVITQESLIRGLADLEKQKA